MTWFRRLHDDTPPGTAATPEPEPDDSPDALRSRAREVIVLVNSRAGALPGEAVVIARRILDVLCEVIDSADPQRGLDVYAALSVKGMLTDYLPTTLRTYLALDPAAVDVPLPSGRTPAQALIGQLETLWSSADELRDAAHAHDADALLSQGSFLRTKFSGSDLDL